MEGRRIFNEQVAKHSGVHIIGILSAKNGDFMLSNGAYVHIDYYCGVPFENAGHNINILFCIGTIERIHWPAAENVAKRTVRGLKFIVTIKKTWV